MSSLLLVRHGQASFGAADYDRLSSVGEQQSQRLGLWLKACGPLPDLIAIGQRQRHRRTAELCLEAAGVDLPMTVFAGLDEIDHEEVLARHRPDLSDMAQLQAELRQAADPHRAFQQLFGEAVARWTGGGHDAQYAQSWPQFRANVMAALQSLAKHPAQAIWAFTSGGPIGVISNALLGAPPARAFELSWPLVNSGFTQLRVHRGDTTLVTYNAWPHLQPAEHHHLITLR